MYTYVNIYIYVRYIYILYLYYVFIYIYYVLRFVSLFKYYTYAEFITVYYCICAPDTSSQKVFVCVRPFAKYYS